jgi:hypothetical protein
MAAMAIAIRGTIGNRNLKEVFFQAAAVVRRKDPFVSPIFMGDLGISNGRRGARCAVGEGTGFSWLWRAVPCAFGFGAPFLSLPHAPWPSGRAGTWNSSRAYVGH